MCFSALFALLLMLIHVDRGWNLNTVEYSKHLFYKIKGRQIPVLHDFAKLQLASSNWAQARGQHLADIGKSFTLPASVCTWPRQP